MRIAIIEEVQLILTVNCSARKTAPALRLLRASALKRGDLPSLVEEWRARVVAVTERIRADTLYEGRAFSLARKVADASSADLRIISAGMGLLKRDARIPSYDLSVTPGTKDSILDRALSGTQFSAQEWWHAIQRPNLRRPIASALREQPRALMVIAASATYVQMVSEELAELDDALRTRIRIVGIKNDKTVAAALRSHVMPYDTRLNDAALRLQGTEHDYSARALTHFIGLIRGDRQLGSAQSHARRVRQSLSHFCAPRRAVHRRVEDGELRGLIAEFKRRGLAMTKALGTLRNKEKLACEQNRFARLWEATRVKKA